MFFNEITIKRAPKTKKTPITLDDQIAEGIGHSAASIFHDALKDSLKPSVICIVGALVAIKVVDTLCEIAVNKTA